jgi:hypothetical protein
MAKFFTNVSLGIVVAIEPYTFVPVGNELGRHVRVACGKQTPPTIVKRKVEGMQFERQFIERGSYMRINSKPRILAEGEEPDATRSPPKERLLLVNERENDVSNAIVLAQLPSGYKGDSVISVHDKAQIIADCFVGHGVRGSLGVSHYALAYLAPGGELRGQVTGHRVKNPFCRWIFDGEEIIYIEGGEDVFYNASEHTSRLGPAD